MIKYLSVGFLLLIFSIATHAQNTYTQERLEKMSLDDLSIYLTKAQKTKKTGGILLITAPVEATVGVLLWTNAWRGGSEAGLSIGSGLIIASLVSTAVGIPVRITGSSRVKRVSKIWNAKQGSAMIDISPFSIYDFHTQNKLPGVKLRITF